MTTHLDSIIKEALEEILNLPTSEFNDETPLLGSFAELDSMGILTLLMKLESQLCISMNDAVLSAEMFTTYGTLYENILTLLPVLKPNKVAP